MLMYHGGDWLVHQGGIRGLLQAYASDNPSAATSYGDTPNIVNLTDYEDACEWMLVATYELSSPGIVYAIDISKLDRNLFRPNDIMGRDTTVEDSLEQGLLSHEGPITDAIVWVEKHTAAQDDNEEDPERFEYKSPEHLAQLLW